jgi:hypothetical protein
MNQLTFRDLKKRVSLEIVQQNELFVRVHNKPFWIWNMEEHKQGDIRTNGDCCFNHIIGLPQKNNIDSIGNDGTDRNDTLHTFNKIGLMASLLFSAYFD